MTTTDADLARALRQQAANPRLAAYKRRDLLDAAAALEEALAAADRFRALERLEVYLGSLVVRAQELGTALDVSLDAFKADFTALKAIANLPAVADWLATIDPALLPLKR